MMERRGFTVLAYLDDFLIISDTAIGCQQAYDELIKLLGERFQINWDKVVGPCQRLTFLGIEIDTVHRQLSLSKRKVCELRLLLSEAIYHKADHAIPCWETKLCRTRSFRGKDILTTHD